MKTYGHRAFSVTAARLWNKLPFEICACSDVNLFKSKLKTLLFKKAYDIQFHHICFCFLSFLRCICYKFPNMYSSVATFKNDVLCTLTITCRLQFTTVRCSTTRFLTTILISFSSAIRFFMSIIIFLYMLQICLLPLVTLHGSKFAVSAFPFWVLIISFLSRF